ncbi:MAG: hypothetical protein ABI920_04655 [Casimicrobiaceae bacterium]
MHTLERTGGFRERTPAATMPVPAYVDCLDPARQDLLVYWLERAGIEVHEGLPPQRRADESGARSPDVLLTDRFGPGLAGEIVIGELKESHPGIVVVVLGCGDAGELAQLSLARVAGADATLATPFDRDAVLRFFAPLS